MERVKLYCGGVCRGEIALTPEGSRTDVWAVMEDPGDGLYRAVLCGGNGEILLGVLAPEKTTLELKKKLYSRDVSGLGQPLRGEARCSFRFRESGWQETRFPAQLFQEAFLQDRLRSFDSAWWRRDGDLLYLALPLVENGPFPLESLFCLARLEPVEGAICAVYAFRKDEPVMP